MIIVSKIDNIKAFVERRYIKTDRFVESINYCCSIGCNYCCYQSIEILNIERPLIHDFVMKNIVDKDFEIIRDNLSNWLDYFDNNTPNKLTLKLEDVFINFRDLSAKGSLKCPFLINGLCSIYDRRPLTCRVHVVEDSPEKCNISKLRDAAPLAHKFRIELKEEITKITDIYLVPLPYAVSDIFLPKRKLKKIETRNI
jgi:Fe-S-cluster containining protein